MPKPIMRNGTPRTKFRNGLLIGTLDLYGNMGLSDGGISNRYSLSSNFWSKGENYKMTLTLTSFITT